MNFPGKFSDHILPHKIHNINVSFGLEKLNIQFGGTAGNIAYNLSLFGQHPYVVSQIGHDFKPYQRWLQQQRVRLQYVRFIATETCATAHIITDQRDNQIAAFHFGAMQQPAVTSLVTRQLAKQLTQPTALGLLAAGNLSDMLTLAQLYLRKGVRYILDPGQQTIWLTATQFKTLLRGAAVLVVNDYELALIEKKLNTTAKALANKLDRLIVTLGDHGANWYVDGKIFKMPIAKPIRVVDPTGAGDAYRAGVIMGLLYDWDIMTTGQVAALCATYAIEQYGTQQHRYTRQQFKKRYYQLFKKKVAI
ncbi:MAG: carbohydrate kinase family protein [Candidatus Kerfeldbacteria bacterium]|nr:carbohydrate kinase family protein [Candidatus Kerfeldbacteria bacterium]